MNRKIEEVRPLDSERLLTTREVADFLRVSVSWLAKARMRGDGPSASIRDIC
jgi:hypothetical protein